MKTQHKLHAQTTITRGEAIYTVTLCQRGSWLVSVDYRGLSKSYVDYTREKATERFLLWSQTLLEDA
jgi:hypothetical protein